jgi:hypothetical protein
VLQVPAMIFWGEGVLSAIGQIHSSGEMQPGCSVTQEPAQQMTMMASRHGGSFEEEYVNRTEFACSSFFVGRQLSPLTT